MILGNLFLYFFVILSLVFVLVSFNLPSGGKKVVKSSSKKKSQSSNGKKKVKSVGSLRKKIPKVNLKRKSSGSHSWEKDLK